jgi:hypothetical protein
MKASCLFDMGWTVCFTCFSTWHCVSYAWCIVSARYGYPSLLLLTTTARLKQWHSPFGTTTFYHSFNVSSLHCLSRCCSNIKSWRRAAAHPILWKMVRFCADTPTRLWPSLLSRMAAAGTVAWDLRGVGAAALSSSALPRSCLAALKHVWLPESTPFEAVPAYTTGSPGLESLLVEAFAHGAGRLDFRHVGGFEKLRTLQLRATHGLKLPAFSFTGGTDALAGLANLRVLELTGLRGASAADFFFIGGLHQLQSLALGECSLWDSSVYRALSGLAKLTRLRLEARHSALLHRLLRVSQLLFGWQVFNHGVVVDHLVHHARR